MATGIQRPWILNEPDHLLPIPSQHGSGYGNSGSGEEVGDHGLFTLSMALSVHQGLAHGCMLKAFGDESAVHHCKTEIAEGDAEEETNIPWAQSTAGLLDGENSR